MRYTESMSKETTVCILGMVVFFIPFAGLPREYKEWALIVSGVLLMMVGYSLRRISFLRSIEDGNGGKIGEVFRESGVILQKEQSDEVDQKLQI